jgi:hypothetical protein
MKNKKAQLSQLPNAILFLTASIVILVVSLVMVNNLRDSDTVRKANVDIVNNETTTSAVTEVPVNLAKRTAPGSICTVLSVTNQTLNRIITSANYTLTNSGCTIAFATGGSPTPGINNTKWNVTYSYSYGDSPYTASNKSIIGLGEFTDFIPLIVLAVISAIIITIILSSFVARRRNR